MSAYRFDDCVVDLDAFQVHKAGSLVPLEPKSIRVLAYLLEHRGRLVPKDELMQAVWGETFVTDNALTRVIAQLRKALGDNAKQARYIETVPTQGYRFIAVVGTGEQAPAAAPRKPRWPRAAAAAVAIMGVAGVWVWRDRPATAEAMGESALHGTAVQFTTSAGLDSTPAISPDGNTIAYASDRNGGFEIYTRPVSSGGREIQVTRDGGQNAQPTWSPDGSRIAYYSAKRGGISVIPASGGFSRMLTDFGSDPEWSPDGQWIAFRSGGFLSLVPPDTLPPVGSRIWVVAAEGGAPRQVTDAGKPGGAHGGPSWTGDGRIVFGAYGGPDASFWAVAADGTGLEKFPRPERYGVGPVVSHDGRRIYAACRTSENSLGLCQIDASTGKTTEFLWTGVSVPRDLNLSRDGKMLAYTLTSMTSNLWTLPVTRDGRVTGPPAQLMRDTSVRNSLPSISPDGRSIAFNSRRRGSQSDVFVFGPGGAVEQITNHPASDIMPSWTPDGRSVVYSSTRNGGTQIWKVSLADGKETLLLDSPNLRSMARLSPDGRFALFHRPDKEGLGLWRITIPGGELLRLSPEEESMGFASWSRDGKWVAVERIGRDWNQAGILPSAGGAYRPLSPERGQNWPHSWSPDSTKVAMAALRDGVWNVWWVGLDGQERRLTSNETLRTYVRYPEWSPTGDRIVYEFAEATGNVYVMRLNSP